MANMPRCLQNNDRTYSRRNGRAHHKNDSRSKAATAGRQECHPSKLLSKSRVQVVKVEPRCVIEALSQTRGVEVLPEKDAEHEATIKAEFGEWHAHWQVRLKVQEREKHGAREARGSLGPTPRMGALRRAAAANK